MKKLIICSLLSALTLASHAADPQKASPGAVSDKDRKFITEAAQGGMTEVAVGRLATEKGSSPEVKKMGEMLVQDHSKANMELKKLAGERGVVVPLELDPKHSAMAHKLGTEEGEKFDKEFVEMMSKDHKEDIEKFQVASKELTDPELRGFAAKQLPVLEKHKQHIDMLGGKK